MESDETIGVTRDLHIDKPYAYSRNPQCVGMIVGLVGFSVLINSLYVSILASLHVGWMLLLPCAEEPHLLEVYGEEYEAYLNQTPRFIDRRTFQRLVS